MSLHIHKLVSLANVVIESAQGANKLLVVLHEDPKPRADTLVHQL